MLVYEALTELPIYDERTQMVVELVREVAWPRMHIRIEAENRRDLARKVEELSNELEAWGMRGLDIEQFSRGKRGTLFEEET